jgi:predicted transcriptional regulator
MQTLGERELDILQVLWQRGSATVGEVHAAFAARGVAIAYNTVQTMLNRLETKKIVARDGSDRAHLYRPLVKERAAVNGAIRKLAQRFFHGSPEALAARLVERDLGDEELDRLESLIAARRRTKR